MQPTTDEKQDAAGNLCQNDYAQKHVTNDELYNMEETNVLVASWINNLGYPEKPLEDKFFFFNSEPLLNNRDLLEHFNPKNSKIFADKNIEFLSKKGIKDGPN